MRILYRNRLLVLIKSCCYIERYSPLDLFESASGVIRMGVVPEYVVPLSSVFSFVSCRWFVV